MNQSNFQKSDMGAQAAWKGFSSQTFYIAARMISDEQGYDNKKVFEDCNRVYSGICGTGGAIIFMRCDRRECIIMHFL